MADGPVEKNQLKAGDFSKSESRSKFTSCFFSVSVIVFNIIAFLLSITLLSACIGGGGCDDPCYTTPPDCSRCTDRNICPVNNYPPYVNAGPDRSIDISASAFLDGTVSDDGLPNPPGVVTVTWSKQSGPGAVYFTNVHAVDTTATFSLVGVYVLVLTGSDSQYVSSDTVTVTVTEVTGPPLVHAADAGPDQTALAPDGKTVLTSAACNALWTDTGLPGWPGYKDKPIKFNLSGNGMTGDGSPLVVQWACAGGPCPPDMNIHHPSSLETAVTLPTGTNYSGYYTFQLTVDNEVVDTDETTATDTVIINVCGSDNEKAPQIDAAVVTAHFAPDLLPPYLVTVGPFNITDADGVNSSSRLWKTWSGPKKTDVTDPATVAFTGSMSSPTVSFPEFGHYILTTTVSDNHASPLQGKARVRVDVLPALFPVDIGILASQSDAGTTIPPVGVRSYGHGDTATIEAVPAAGFELVGWSVVDSQDPSVSVSYTATGNKISFQVNGEYKVKAILRKVGP